MLKNIYGVSSNKGNDALSLPRYATVGISLSKDGYTFSLESEIVHGRYGGKEKKTAQFWLLRGGAEKEIGHVFRIRFGLIYPVAAYTSTAGDIRDEIPWPKIGGAAGIGAEFDKLTIDFAVHGDPTRSYVEQDTVFLSVITLLVNF